MRTQAFACATSLLVALLLASVVSTPAAADPAADELPVPYNFLASVPPALLDENTVTPGINDWNCQPNRAHPNPVVLVHGIFGAENTNWAVYGPLLRNEGYCVFALTYGQVPGATGRVKALGGLASIEETSVYQLDAFIDRVHSATGAPQVDLIGHSEGTVLNAYYLKSGIGAGRVSKVVALAGAYQGSDPTMGMGASYLSQRENGIDLAEITPCGVCNELPTGSAFLEKLNADGSPYVADVAYTNIATRYDQAIMPYTSGIPTPVNDQNVRNIVVQDSCAQDFSEHAGIAGSKRAAMMVLNALDPVHPKAVPCETVLPLTGSEL